MKLLLLALFIFISLSITFVRITAVEPEPIPGTSIRRIRIGDDPIRVVHAYVQVSQFMHSKVRTDTASQIIQKKISVPDVNVARLIGRQGCFIRRIEELTGENHPYSIT